MSSDKRTFLETPKRGYDNQRNAVAALMPGTMVVLGSTGYAAAQPTGVADGRVAVEDSDMGTTITTQVPAGSRVRVGLGSRHEYVQLIVPAAAAAIVQGAELQADSNGKAIVKSGSNTTRAIAEEAVDNSGGGSDVRIRARLV